MWDLFTEPARRVVFYAQEEARLGQNYVSTEHLLLGLLREPGNAASRILNQMEVSPGNIAMAVERMVERGSSPPGKDMQLTPRGKLVIDLAYDEAKRMGNNYLGTEHLLLGMMREADGVAGRVLAGLGADLDRTRQAVVELHALMPPEQVPPPSGPAVAARRPSTLERMKQKGGILGALASGLLVLAKIGAPVLAVLAKLKFLVIFGKLLLTGGSMFLSIFLWSYAFGWPMAIGFVLSIFVHECGHAFAGRLRGIPISGMVFVPFMGAVVVHARGGKSVVEDAFIGIMGPVFGTLYGVGCVLVFFTTHNPFWLALASMVFFINLFNLAPTVPLDGGWIIPVFSPKAMVLGLVLLVPICIYSHNYLILLLGLLSIPRIKAGWKADPRTSTFFQATSRDRWTYGIAYLGLAAFLAAGSAWVDVMFQATRSGL
ncbi:MAG: Clp protease N-terminal domain-containing protein [Capsulimonadaceae bacterium]